MRSWEMGDPARVLERRGEDCDHCKYLERWSVSAGREVTICGNQHAPEAKRKAAPAHRCHWWRHRQADSGV